MTPEEYKTMDYEKAYKEALERANAKIDTYNHLGNTSVVKSICEIFPELKESEDERIKEDLVQWINEFPDTIWRRHYKKDVIAWLEKQGDQKPAKKIVETWKDMRLEVYQQASGNRHEPNYSDDTTKMFSLNDIDEIIEKMSEPKPADKVEPKFKVGDWITDGDRNLFQIIKIDNEWYYADDGDRVCFDVVHDYYSLWTIEDAKDGDVLAASDDSIFIFKEIVGCGCKHYIALEKDNETINLNYNLKHCWEATRGVKPATEEQHSFLFSKMKEAGYEWDSEKKELSKIEQKKDMTH